MICDLKVELIENLKPWGHNGSHQEMKVRIHLSEKAVQDFIHDAAEHYGDEWCMKWLDIKGLKALEVSE